MTANLENMVDSTALDQLTGGAISAPTALARTQLIKQWLETSPAPSYEQMNEVFKLLSAKDKGAARLVKESMDLIKKAHNQEALIVVWTDKANVLLSTPKLNIADAMAWQRDAAKEGAPISKEPLASLRSSLAERVKTIEDLQHRAQVQREAAVLLAQRIEVLSTKYWEEAQSLEGVLQDDMQRWRAEQETLIGQKDWISVDPKYTPALQTSAEHLQIVWEAFSAALKQAALCATDPSQDLPAVPAWADQIKQKRSESSVGEKSGSDSQNQKNKKPAKIEIDPAVKAAAKQAMQLCMSVLEKELSQGHGKASAGAAADLRQALKEYGHVIDDRLDKQAQTLLAAAGELVDWQRWRADQLRAELVAKAEGLLQRVKPSVEIKGAKAPKTNPNKNSTADKAQEKAPDAQGRSDESVQAQTLLAEVAHPAEVTHETLVPDEAAVPHETQVVSEIEPTLDESKVQNSSENTSSENLTAQALLSGRSNISNEAPVDLTHTSTDTSALSAENHGIDGSTLDTNASDENASSKTASTKSTPSPDYVPTMGPRKLQETLRRLREDWKQTDQGGMPNHALWKRFDNACNLAYPFVQEWLQQTRAQSQANRTQRLELIAEVKTWAAEHSKGPDWRAVQRQLHDFSEKWRACGHVSEKVFAEVQALWKEAIQAAHLPIEKLQNESIARRKALIEESKSIGALPTLKIDLIKAIQQRWQDESHVVPIDRKLAQRLWDDFKRPLDEAFQRKTAERAQIAHAMSAHDEAVLKASKALEQAVQEGDASKIKAAMQHLQMVSVSGEPVANTVHQHPQPQSRSQPQPAEVAQATAETTSNNQVANLEDAKAVGESLPAQDGLTNPVDVLQTETSPSDETIATDVSNSDSTEQAPHAEEQPPIAEPPKVTPKAPPKVVVAVRGDDRPGAKKADTNSSQDGRSRSGSGGFGGGRGKDSRDSRGSGRGGNDSRDSRDSRSQRDSREIREPRGPRLGDVAFRAQRQALETAEAAMRKLAAQAHGQTLTNLMSAWQDKNPELVPALKELGSRVNAAQRANWVKAIQQSESKQSTDALLRLEMAADAPTPASDLQARRNLQLQLLTKRNDPAPAQTWADDAATVMAGPFDAEVARRLQGVLKTLLKH